MNDLISRQEAINVILHYTIRIPGYMSEWGRKLTAAIKKDLMGEINAIPPAQQWIPVEERFPGYRSTVLVYCSERKNMYCAFFDQGVWWVFGAYCTPISEEVTVWMPLPEPYAPTQSNDSKALDALDSN